MRAFRRQMCQVVDPCVQVWTIVGMSGRHLSSQRVIEREDAERLERLRVEHDRQRDLGQRYEVIAQLTNADIRVVRHFTRKGRSEPLEEGTDRIGRKLCIRNFARLPVRLIGLTLQIAVGIGNGAIVEGNTVEHGKTIKPMAILVLPYLELRRPGAQEGTREPGGKSPPDR